jgi:hypothetical protein
MKLEHSQNIFDKHTYIKVNKNPLNGSGDGHADRRTDMAKLYSFFAIYIYFISNLGILMKTGHYADVILEVCCGRQKLENR